MNEETCPDCKGTRLGEVKLVRDTPLEKVGGVKVCARCKGTGRVPTQEKK